MLGHPIFYSFSLDDLASIRFRSRRPKLCHVSRTLGNEATPPPAQSPTTHAAPPRHRSTVRSDLLRTKMLPSKRGADDDTTQLFPNKNGRSCCSCHSPENSRRIWSQMSQQVASNLSRSVAFIVLRTTNNGRISGQFCAIAIERRNDATRFVTSGYLVEVLQYDRREEIKIEVYCEGNAVAVGHLEEHDPECELAVVQVKSSLDVQCVHLDHRMEFMPHEDDDRIAVVGRDPFGNLLIADGLLSYGGDKDFLVFADAGECSMSCLGEVFFDFHGNFVGMNHRSLLPPRIVLERSTSTQRRAFRYVGMNGWFETTSSGEHRFHPKAYDCVDDKEQYRDLYNLGYPIPSRTVVNSGWVLNVTYEDTFGDMYPKGVWASFGKRASSEISQSVVALASFNGERRFFACSGVFVDFHDECQSTILTSACLVTAPFLHTTIVEGLRIEVLLPNKQRVDGTLLHYSLHYNVALVSVKNYRARYPVNLKDIIPLELADEIIDTKVLAVGRIFASGALMATSGKITVDTDMLDCCILWYSTCQVSTMAGIGGPLVDVDGNYIGMNFLRWHKEIGTAYLYREDLRGILEYFRTKTTTYLTAYGLAATVTEDGQEPINKWPVSKPSWCDPSMLEDDITDDDKHDQDQPDGLQTRLQTRYIDGIKVVLK